VTYLDQALEDAAQRVIADKEAAARAVKSYQDGQAQQVARVGNGARLGRAVQDGVIRYLSPSSITKADPGSTGGCLRRWWFRYVAMRQEAEGKAQILGTQMHAELKEFLLTGKDSLGKIARALKQWIPTPIPVWDATPHLPYPGKLWTEYEISGDPILSDPILFAAGIPIIGSIDVRNHRDPIREVLDWKSTSSLDYLPTPELMANTVQMSSYGEYEARYAELREGSRAAAPVRLTHGYTVTKGPADARRVSLVVTREQLARRWEEIEGVTRCMVDAAKEVDPNKVDANTAACFAYNRRCDHFEVCTAAQHNSLNEFTKPVPESPMSVDVMKMLGMTQSPAAPTTPAPVAPAAPAPMTMAERLAALEAQERAVAPQVVVQAPPPPTYTLEFAEAAKALDAAGWGWPAVTGEAASMKSALTGVANTGHGFAGSGKYGALTVSTAQEVIELAAYVTAERAKIMTPVAQLPKVETAAPVPPVTTPPMIAPAPPVITAPVLPSSTGMTPSILPPDVPASDPAAITAMQLAESAPKNKAGRKAKAETTPAIPVSDDLLGRIAYALERIAAAMEAK
jgi:hypothetical protein